MAKHPNAGPSVRARAAAAAARRPVVDGAVRPVVEQLEGRLVMAATLPAGFAEAKVGGGFNEPTDMAVAPDGRLFVTEKGGAVRVIKNGSLLSTPFATLSVDTYRDRGLDAIALDPGFASNGYVYLYYTKSDPSNPNTSPNGAVNRLSRVTVDPASPDRAKSGSEVVLLDNIPSNTGYHIGGLLEFGTDGKIYLGTGDGGVPFDAQTSGVTSFAQDLNSLGGKILRLNPDGTAPADNPFAGQAGKRPEVWAYGMRNPFSGAVDPVTGKVFANDVGQASWEEVDAITKGGNFGWPGAEGNSTNPAYIDPLYTYAHNPNTTYSASVTGGLFYRGNQFPAAYAGQYFVADYIQGWIKTVNPTTGAVADFAWNTNGPIRMEAAADGGFYYLSHNDLAVYKVSYVGAVNRAPAAVASATPTSGLAPLTVSFSGTGSTDPDGDPLTYAWDFGDGTTGTGKTASHTYTVNGTYAPKLTVSDGRLTNTTSTAAITVGAVAPTATITLPSNGALYTAGDVISFAGTATDPQDGTLPASAFNWSVVFHHQTHTHGFIDSIPGVKSGTFTIPTTGETDPVQWYEIRLTVTDSQGLTGTASVNVNPRVVNVTLAASTPGLTVNFDGQPVTTPRTFGAVAGMVRGLGAPASQVFNGATYQFVSWSDGGAANHNATTPTTDVTYAATYKSSTASGPYSGTAAAVPGTIKVSDYDLGGEGVAYHDTTTTNDGGASYRTAEGVDLEVSGDAGNPLNLSWVRAGEWVNYTVNVAAAGTYTITPRVASLGAGGRFHFEFNGAAVGSAFTVPDTGGWQAYQPAAVTGVSLPKGQGVLRLVCDTEGVNGFGGNVSSIAVADATTTVPPPPPPPPPSGQAPYGGTPWPVAGQIEAENYDTGGEGVAYHDVDAANQGGAYRGDGVDVEGSTDAGGGYAVGHIAAGEWLEYTVGVAAAGTYDLGLRFASGNNGGTAHLEVDGTAVGGSITLPGTGGWTTWATVAKAGLSLPAGQHVLRLAFDTTTGGEIGVLNWLKLTASTTTVPPPPPPPTTTVPAAPANLAAAAVSSTRVNLTWTDASSNEAGFKVDRKLGANGTWAQIGTTAANVATYADTTGVASANYFYRVRATNAAGDSAYTNTASATTLSDAGQSPFSGTPIAIPGTLQAENFDNGGQGVAFNDTTTSNLGGKYRSTAVDIEATTDAGGGYAVDYTAAGEWLEYTVNVPAAGWFTLAARVSGQGGTAGRFHLEADRVNVTGAMAVPNTKSWSTYATVNSAAFALTAGTHVLRLAVDAAVASGRGPNVNWLKLASAAAPAGTTALAIAAEPAIGPATSVTGLTLVDARTGEALAVLSAGATIDLSAYAGRKLAVRAEVDGLAPGSVVYAVDGRRHRTENHPGRHGKAKRLKLKPGEHVLTATAFEKHGGRGATLGGVSVRVTVIA